MNLTNNLILLLNQQKNKIFIEKFKAKKPSVGCYIECIYFLNSELMLKLFCNENNTRKIL